MSLAMLFEFIELMVDIMEEYGASNTDVYTPFDVLVWALMHTLEVMVKLLAPYSLFHLMTTLKLLRQILLRIL